MTVIVRVKNNYTCIKQTVETDKIAVLFEEDDLMVIVSRWKGVEFIADMVCNMIETVKNRLGARTWQTTTG